MNGIVICGASGLVGSLLAEKLHERGETLILVGRRPEALRREFPFAEEFLSWKQFAEFNSSGVNAIVNLAGAGVMERRWTADYKLTMMESRIGSTKECSAHCLRNPGIHLINASAVHAYGVHAFDHEPFLEGDEPAEGKDCFLHDLITEWEMATQSAAESGAAITHLRLGVVLSWEGGALLETAKPFSWFLGGRHGSGKQIMSWITLRDVVNAIVFLLDNPDVQGPVNLVSPNPCTNLEFARALGAALGRPSFVPMPSLMVRAALGQAGVELVLLGQRVLPGKLQDAGFQFQDVHIKEALEDMLGS